MLWSLSVHEDRAQALARSTLLTSSCFSSQPACLAHTVHSLLTSVLAPNRLQWPTVHLALSRQFSIQSDLDQPRTSREPGPTLGAERSRRQLESGSCRHEALATAGHPDKRHPLGEVLPQPREGGMAPGCGRGLDSGKKPGDDGIRAGGKGTQVGHSFYNHSERSRTGTFAPPPKPITASPPQAERMGTRHKCSQTMRRDLVWLARIWGPLGSLAGEVAATVKGSEAGEGGALCPGARIAIMRKVYLALSFSGLP